MVTGRVTDLGVAAPGPAATKAGTTVASMLLFDRLGMVFPGGTVALQDVDIDVRCGEFVSLLGPSGCGKSTLLRIAAELDRCTSGTVSCAADEIGYVFQDATLLPWRTVRGNVELFAELGGMPKPKMDTEVRRTIELVGLKGFEDHRPRQLSGGMRMRVSLARSLVLNPDLFLFDEPFGALDEITRQFLNDEVLRLYQQEQFTGVFVTHSVAEAVYMSSRVVVMAPRPGRVSAVFDVPFGYPRDEALRFRPEFGRLMGEISTSLRGAHR